MDKVIPLAERTRGLALARAFELAESKPEMPPPGEPGAGDLRAGAPPPISRQPPKPVRTVTLPTSDPGGLPPAPVDIEQGPEPDAPPLPVRVARPRLPAEPPVARPAVVAAADGAWRVQLGAFSNPDGATALWNRLKGRIDTLASFRPLTVRAGSITRLQTGPVASRAAAEKLCAIVKAAGQACVTVAP